MKRRNINGKCKFESHRKVSDVVTWAKILQIVFYDLIEITGMNNLRSDHVMY